MQLAKQVGEYLVAAELCRRGLIATTFTGNVPGYDIVAISEDGERALVQVKALRGGSWQFNATVFLDITQKGKMQVLGQPTTPKYPDLICVFVLLDIYGNDRFFVLKWVELQDLIARHYREYLQRVGGIRPRKPKSYHFGLQPVDLEKYENRWEIIEELIATKGCRQPEQVKR